MADPIPVSRLFETHLTVRDLGRSVSFYRDVVGLPVALELPERGATFFWVGAPGETMLGLWSLGSMPMGMSLHVAFGVELNDLLAAPARLRELGVAPMSFFGDGHRGAQRDRLDAGRRDLLPRPGRPPAGIPDDARRGAAPAGRDHPVVAVASVIATAAVASTG